MFLVMSCFCIVWYCLISSFDMWYSTFISSICIRLVLIDHEYLTGRLCFEISSFAAGTHRRPHQFKVDWIFLDNPFDTSRMWAWNSAYSTEWTLLDHLVPKLHWSKAWFLTPILWVNYWKTTLIQTLCLFTLLNAEQSRFAPSCYGGVLLEKYFCDLSALEGPRGQCYIPLPHKSGLNEAFCYSHPATSAFTPCLSEWSIWLRVNSDQLNHFIFQLWR